MWICHLFSTRKESRNVAEDCEWKASWAYSMEPASYHKEPSDRISRSTQTLPASVRVSGRVCVRVHTLEGACKPECPREGQLWVSALTFHLA